MEALLFTLEEKEVMLQNYLKKGIADFEKFRRNDLIKINKLFNEILIYEK